MTQPPGQWSEAAAPSSAEPQPVHQAPPQPAPAPSGAPVPSGPPATFSGLPSYAQANPYAQISSPYAQASPYAQGNPYAQGSPYAQGNPYPQAGPYAQAGPHGQVNPYAPPVAPPPAEARWQPERVEALPGTEFGLVQLRIAPISSGPAVGSLVAGIASVLVSLVVLCFGLAGSSEGWGALVAGAFCVLAVLAGGGAIAVGLAARRQIGSRVPGQIRFTGRGMAIAGISCGTAGVGIALLSVALALVLQLS